MLQLLFGRPGSGKTRYITEKIKESVIKGRRTYLLVPEQQIFTSEAMLADLPPSSALCFEVVSFSRLCAAVFSKYGGSVDTSTENVVRNLIMWQNIREISSSLNEYDKTKTDASFGSMMLSAVDELRAGGITPEDCENASEKCSDITLSKKLHDVALIYANFNRLISERLGEGAFASENKLSRMLALLKENRFFEGCDIFVDSFTSFTGEEHAILDEIALQADLLCVSFCRDAKAKDLPHTESIDATILRFKRFAKEHGVEVKTTPLSGDCISSAAAHLESGLWNFSLTKNMIPSFSEDETSFIEPYICKNDFDEVELAAIKILQEYRRGVKFSEMAVIMRDAESRKGVIEAVFERSGIPYFFSEKTDLSTTAAARLIFSAMRCVIYNFRMPDILTLIKTGLCGIEPYEADLFEDYCYTWNINGDKFLEDTWSMNPDGYTADKPSERAKEILLAANRVRKVLIPPLFRLKQKFSLSRGNTLENCRALYDYLSEIGLQQSLTDLAEFDLISGNLRSAGEHLRLYDCLISAITDVGTILSDTLSTPEELSCALEIILRNSDMGSVPAVGDCVTVGSASTLRVENVKVAIVLGLCEGEFPQSYSDSGIFTESDKAIMEDLDIDLVSRESRVISDELFYAYRALTKPSEKLVISTSTSRVGGGSLTPSSAWTRVIFLFPDLKPYKFDLSLIKRIAAAFAEGEEDIKLEDTAESQNEEDSQGDFVTIDPMQVRIIFGSKIELSQTKISTFSNCPYQYWCKYVLELREKKISTVSYNNSGTIVHYVLEKYIKDVKNSDGTLRRPDDAETVKMVNEYVDDYIRSIGCPLPPSMMYSFSRLRDLALIMVKSVIDEFDDSSFKVLAQELRISEISEKGLKPIIIKVREGEDSPTVILKGVVDRLDFYEDSDHTYLRVVDYKTGSHPFNVNKIESGKDLQLPAYLFTAALKENQELIGSKKEILPAAALFLSANDSSGLITPERSGFFLNNEDLLRAASGSMNKSILAGISKDKKTGMLKGNAVSKEAIDNIESVMRETIAKTGRSIFEGRAPRTPSKDACQYCFLRSACPVACK